MQSACIALWVHRFSLCRTTWLPTWEPRPSLPFSSSGLPEKCYFINDFSRARQQELVSLLQIILHALSLPETFLGVDLYGIVVGFFHHMGMGLALALLASCGLLLFQQLRSVYLGTTPIDRLKGTQKQVRTFTEGLSDVMGCEFGWRWFLPTPVAHKTSKYLECPPWVGGNRFVPPSLSSARALTDVYVPQCPVAKFFTEAGHVYSRPGEAKCQDNL